MIETHRDHRGNLTVIEKLPFEIKRVYFIHGVPPEAMRGAHAHKETERFIFAASGSFVMYINGSRRVLSDPSIGMFIPKMSWVKLSNFSDGAVCLIVASKEHDPDDCIRDYDEYLRLTN